VIHVTKERVTGPKPDQGRKSQEATIGVTREPVTRLLSEFKKRQLLSRRA
jgi:CRP-like cAMP-binding protein